MAGKKTDSTRVVELLEPVEHDGVRYEPGAGVALPVAAADALVAAGAARDAQASLDTPAADPAA